MTTRFPTATFKNESTGFTAEGSIVLESSTAWQVAVDGKVQVLQKSEWAPHHVPFPAGVPGSTGFDFGQFFGGKP